MREHARDDLRRDHAPRRRAGQRADQLGLSQAYQIRGRVGRSRERAFAYMLYPSPETLTADAAARLSTLSDNTELGSGFRVAMRDLEIRGAGNLLGDEQSGHIREVGVELYQSMLEEAVAALDDAVRTGNQRLAALQARQPAPRRATETQSDHELLRALIDLAVTAPAPAGGAR